MMPYQEQMRERGRIPTMREEMEERAKTSPVAAALFAEVLNHEQGRCTCKPPLPAEDLAILKAQTMALEPS